jgi:predicted amidohydrolase YtcJ
MRRMGHQDSARVLLRDAELAVGVPGGSIRRADIRVSDEIVAEIAPSMGRRPGETVIDCDGGAVIPGLCDHHLHLHAMAAARSSVRCGPPAVTSPAALATALAAAVPDAAGWVRGTGYFESVAGDLDAAALDRMRAGVPVRVQHRSGALWILNTAALRALGLAGTSDAGVSGTAARHPGVERDAAGLPTGRLWRADDWLRTQLGTPTAGASTTSTSTSHGRLFPSLLAIGRELLGYGITAVTDATPDLADAAIAHISDSMLRAELPQRVRLLGVPLGVPPPSVPGLTVGPYKIVLADSGMLTYPELTGRITAAHGSGRPVAVHCVTREALVLLVAALGETGTLKGDRVEHAGIVPEEMVADLSLLRVRVVTQPGFLADRGDDFLRGLPAAEHADLYRCGSLLRAGVPVALASDAPYGPADPWAVMAAAASRRTASGVLAGERERISFEAALNAYLGAPEDPGGAPRRIRAGLPADLVVLRDPLALLPGAHRGVIPESDSGPVRAVVAAGRLTLS